MELAQAFFDFLTQPNVAYALLVAGLLMLVLAFAVPGTGVVEAAAVLCLVLAVIGLSRLPVNIAGIALIIVGVALLVVDLKLQSGLVALAGAAGLGIGSLFLFRPDSSGVSVSLWLIGLVTLGTAAFFGFALNRAMRAMRVPLRTGDTSALVGQVGVLRTELNAENHYIGTAHVAGELWTVKSDRHLPTNGEVVVERVEGLTLLVRPRAETHSEAET